MLNNGYYIVCRHKELKKELKLNKVNWFNFYHKDIYYNDNGRPYTILVNHTEKVVLFQ